MKDSWSESKLEICIYSSTYNHAVASFQCYEPYLPVLKRVVDRAAGSSCKHSSSLHISSEVSFVTQENERLCEYDVHNHTRAQVNEHAEENLINVTTTCIAAT